MKIIEDEEHAFFNCPSFKYACIAFNRLRRHFSLSTLTSWDEVRTGILPHPQQFFSQIEIGWDSKSTCVLSKETPSELLRFSILWNIWATTFHRRTQKEIGEESFHLRSILFKSWKITIQMKMAAWKDIFSQVRNIQRRSIFIQIFQEAWFYNNCFGSYDSHNIFWNLLCF